ncbi:hypothetical protein IJ847_00925 [Candidatus Saccharibacteria bacterium]|nr:hypothetical protein [Candidatus Saccharibacteria bacterium]
MGVLVQNDDEKTSLQERISADLRVRMESTSAQEDVDLVEDSELLRGTKQTARGAWFWGVLILLAALSLVVIFVLK